MTDILRFTIPQCNWKITVFYDVTCEDRDILIFNSDILASSETICGKIVNKLFHCGNNTGFTCTDIDAGESIVVIGKGSDYKEVLNTIVHESLHVAVHLSTLFDVDFESEDFCYLGGYIGENILYKWLESKKVFMNY